MTTVTLVCGRDGAIRSCVAEGHAGFAAKGYDIVCAAVTVLIRTAMQTLSQTDGVTMQANVTERGKLAFAVTEAAEGKTERLACIADFLDCGVQSLQSEYPQFIRLQKQIKE